ncbi:ABC transporter permease [Gluconacetobacter sp. Hr-1-5]|uniref:ABC transporter permease n=1 Tax=Gluconacetobacter sp. Hr-1-5 TaxID=3395370 RepID=UPI003B51FB02
MLGMTLRSVARQARRHPLYVGLNVLGLALGIGVFLTLSLLVRYEYSYNAGLLDVDRLVRVDMRSSEPGTATREYEAVTFRALPFLRADFPEIEDAVRIESDTLQVRRDGDFVHFDAAHVDPSFLRVFGARLVQGTGDALARPDGLVLSETAAKRVFGTSDVLGRALTVDSDGEMSRHVVTGIMRGVAGPNFLAGTEMLVSIPANDEKSRACYLHWGSSCGSVYLKLHRSADIASVEARLRDFVIRRASGSDGDEASLGPHPEKTFALVLVQMRAARFHDAHVIDASNGVDRNVIDGIGLIGVLALALACANAVNLATARSLLRAREVAIRKTLGGTRRALFLQFMGEALFLTAGAGALGLALCEMLVPEVASLMGEGLAIRYGFVLGMLMLVVVGCGLACGVYPALVLSGYRPAAVLAAAKMPSGGRGAARLRDGLVIGQFAIAVTIVIGMVVIHRQTDFLRSADQGYERSGLLIGSLIPSDDIAVQRRLREALRAVPGVQSLAFGMLAPRPGIRNQWNYTYDGAHGTASVVLLRDMVDAGYRDVYRPRLLAGRWFDPARGQDETPDYRRDPQAIGNVILNATAVAKFGFATPADAIGKVIDSDHWMARIIGVIADVRFESPRQPVFPGILFFNSLKENRYNSPIPAVRFAGVPAMEMEKRLRRAWADVLPDVAGQFQTPEQRLDVYYRGDEQRGRIFTLGAVAAMVIAALGLYGLASFAAARRIHEIGIRKTLGATGGQVMGLLLCDFLRPVAFACVLACPAGWLIMRGWLSAFDERIALGPAAFVIAVGGALAIATLTVIGQALRLSRVEPARALRAE